MLASMSEIASMLVTHSKASIDEIERAWHGDVQTLLKWVASQERVKECAVLKTCKSSRDLCGEYTRREGALRSGAAHIRG